MIHNPPPPQLFLLKGPPVGRRRMQPPHMGVPFQLMMLVGI